MIDCRAIYDGTVIVPDKQTLRQAAGTSLAAWLCSAARQAGGAVVHANVFSSRDGMFWAILPRAFIA
jgi:hypothetical protein